MFPLRFSGSRGQENNFGSIQAEPGALRWSPVVPVQGVSSLRQQPGVWERTAQRNALIVLRRQQGQDNRPGVFLTEGGVCVTRPFKF